MAAKVTKISKTTKAADTKKREPKPLPVLEGESLAQFEEVEKAAEAFVAAVAAARRVPGRNLYAAKSTLTQRFVATLKGRKLSKAERRKAQLAARLAKIQAELKALEQAG